MMEFMIQLAEKEVRDDRTLILKHGEPMIFGKENDKGTDT